MFTLLFVSSEVIKIIDGWKCVNEIRSTKAYRVQGARAFRHLLLTPTAQFSSLLLILVRASSRPFTTAARISATLQCSDLLALKRSE